MCEGAETAIKDTLQQFHDPRRSEKLRSVYGSYLATCGALSLSPHPIDRVRLSIFALAHLQGLCGDVFRQYMHRLVDIQPLSPTAFETALDNLSILQQVTLPLNPAELDDATLEREMKHWHQWRDEMRKLVPTLTSEP